MKRAAIEKLVEEQAAGSLTDEKWQEIACCSVIAPPNQRNRWTERR